MPDFTSILSSSGTVRLGRRAARVVPVVLALAVLGPGCSSSTPTNPGGISRSALTITVAPNPIPATQNATTFAVTASYTITVTESAGLGGEVQFINAAAYDPSTGAQVSQNYFDSTDLVVYKGSKRIDAKGTLTLQQTTTYTLADHSKATNLVVSMQFKDDNTNLDFASLLVKIQ